MVSGYLDSRNEIKVIFAFYFFFTFSCLFGLSVAHGVETARDRVIKGAVAIRAANREATERCVAILWYNRWEI